MNLRQKMKPRLQTSGLFYIKLFWDRYIKETIPGRTPGLLKKVCTKPYQEGTGFIRRYKFYFIFKGYMDMVSTDLDFECL
jgi:hypothetical protein